MSDHPVLYCYDGSAGSKHALSVASKLLAGEPAVVTSIWKSAIGALVAVPYAPLSSAAIEETDAEIRKRTQGLCDEGRDIVAHSHPTVEERLEESPYNPWKAILDIADQIDASVIVVGSRGLGAISSHILGSVSHALANHSHRPLLIIPPNEPNQS